MIQRPGFRFSLLTLMLLLTLAAVSVSHWLTNQTLHSTRTKLVEQSRTIRGLNDELGRLTVDDPTQVHMISLTARLQRQYDAPLKNPCKWQAYFPPDTDWKVCWAAGPVPKFGKPRGKSGTWRFKPPPDGKVLITVSQGPRLDDRMSIVVRFGDNLWFDDIPSETVAPFRKGDSIDSRQAGVAGTQSHSGTGGIELIRQSHSRSSPHRNQGFVIWLEPAPPEPEQGTPQTRIAGRQ